MLVIGILQGNRLDWFESNLISGLLGVGRCCWWRF
jgi:DHA2 family multidrug resistance protein